MFDQETRQLAWDCALVTGFKFGKRLAETFDLYAYYINLRDEKDIALHDAVKDLKRIPPLFLTESGAGTPVFVARFLPRINDKMYELVFGKKRDILDVVLTLNKSSIDTAKQASQDTVAQEKYRMKARVLQDDVSAQAMQTRMHNANHARTDWHIVKGLR